MSNSLRYRERTAEVAEQMRKLWQSQPELLSAFGALGAAATKDGALTKKTRELVALGIAISCRCDDCIGFHMQSLIKLKATREEVEEVAGVAVYTGGGPSMMYMRHMRWWRSTSFRRECRRPSLPETRAWAFWSACDYPTLLNLGT